MGTIARWFHGREYIKLLLHWRWLVLLIAVPVSLVIELLEGGGHDLHLLDEVILDGMVLPVTTWVVLTFAAQKMAGQFQREADLERRRQFTQRLGEHREYYDLAQYLVRFPSSILPADQVHLYIVDPASGGLTLAAEWGGAGVGVPAAPLRQPAQACAACRKAPVAHDSRDGLCAACAVAPMGPPEQIYSLVLMHEKAQVGTLRLRWRQGEEPSAENLALLVSLAPEIAMALARAIEDSQAAARAYREAQAYERRRLTQELHDSLAQQVFYLNLSLDQLADDVSLSANEPLQRKLASMRDVASDVYEQIRNNLSILRAWEQVDLTEAVSELARATARNADLSVAIDVQGEPGWLSPHTCEHVYSVVREALNNVVKHAGARHVQLALVWSPERLAISLADDGRGFDPAHATREGHYGLALMRETVEAAQGELHIASAPGQGTVLAFVFPLHLLSPTLQTRPGVSQRLQTAAELALS